MILSCAYMEKSAHTKCSVTYSLSWVFLFVIRSDSLDRNPFHDLVWARHAQPAFDGQLDEAGFTPLCRPGVLNEPVVECLSSGLALCDSRCAALFSFVLGIAWARLSSLFFSRCSAALFCRGAFSSSGHRLWVNAYSNNSVVKSSGAPIRRSQHTTFVVPPAIIPSRHCKSQGTFLHLVDGITDAACDLSRLTGAWGNQVILVCAAFGCFTRYVSQRGVGVVGLGNSTLISGEVPVAGHPASTTTIGAIDLAEHVIVGLSVRCAVDTLLLRKSDGGRLVSDSLHGFLG